MSSSVTTLSLFQGVSGFVAGANPGCLWAKAGYNLDKSPAHRRALKSNLGFGILLKDTAAQLSPGELSPITSRPSLPTFQQEKNPNVKQIKF